MSRPATRTWLLPSRTLVRDAHLHARQIRDAGRAAVRAEAHRGRVDSLHSICPGLSASSSPMTSLGRRRCCPLHSAVAPSVQQTLGEAQDDAPHVTLPGVAVGPTARDPESGLLVVTAPGTMREGRRRAPAWDSDPSRRCMRRARRPSLRPSVFNTLLRPGPDDTRGPTGWNAQPGHCPV